MPQGKVGAVQCELCVHVRREASILLGAVVAQDQAELVIFAAMFAHCCRLYLRRFRVLKTHDEEA